MKYTKTVEIEIEITDEDIIELNDLYGEENDDDYFILESLESLLDEFVFIPTHMALEDLPEGMQEKAKITESSGLVAIPENYFDAKRIV